MDTVQCAIELNYCEEQQFISDITHLFGYGKITTQKSLDFVHNNYVNDLKTMEFCQTIVEQTGIPNVNIAIKFCHEITTVSRKKLLLLQTLRSLHNSFDENLGMINASKNFSFVFFTIAAAVAAAVAAANAGLKRPAVVAAAAAASVVLGALGNWTLSFMKRHEVELKKRKEMIGVMIIWTGFAINDLNKIHAAALRLKIFIESAEEMVPETVRRKKEVAALLGELMREDRHYKQDMSSARNFVLQSIIKHLDSNLMMD